jgi:hypothetical protein
VGLQAGQLSLAAEERSEHLVGPWRRLPFAEVRLVLLDGRQGALQVLDEQARHQLPVAVLGEARIVVEGKHLVDGGQEALVDVVLLLGLEAVAQSHRPSP